MIISRFFYKLFLTGSGLPAQFIGTAFAVAPDGGLLTCRHVVDIQIPAGQAIAVFDEETSLLVVVKTVFYPQNRAVDLAYLPSALGRTKPDFLPILTPALLRIGADIYSFGFFAIGGDTASIEPGYFAGKVVNYFSPGASDETASMTLPFPVLEGMSGSPVLTYHNGPKLVGIAIGNRRSRILASEVVEYKDERIELRETVNRIVEFGVAYHCLVIVQFLTSISAHGFVVSDERTTIPNLE
jgi:hypothetical protein